MLIEPGDVIVADGDGVLRIPLADAIAAGADMFEVVGLNAALDASDMIEIDGTWQRPAARE